MSQRRAVLLYLWVYAIMIIASSAMPFIQAGQVTWLRVLAGAEIIAALLLLIPRTRVIGLSGLLIVFGVAAAAHWSHGDPALRLVIYAASPTLATYLLSSQPGRTGG